MKSKRLIIISCSLLLLCSCARTVYRVTSEPSNAQVNINSCIRGFTPTTVSYSNVKKRPVPFMIIKRGYVTQTGSLGPAGGNIHFVLEALQEPPEPVVIKHETTIKIERTWIAVDVETKLRNIVINESNLKDPFSVKFRKIKVTAVPISEKNKVPIINYCGYLNAKNSMGGYIGWHPFFISTGVKDGPVIWIAEDESCVEFTLIKGACEGSGVFD